MAIRPEILGENECAHSSVENAIAELLGIRDPYIRIKAAEQIGAALEPIVLASLEESLSFIETGD